MGAAQTQEIRVRVTADARQVPKELQIALNAVRGAKKQVEAVTSKIPGFGAASTSELQQSRRGAQTELARVQRLVQQAQKQMAAAQATIQKRTVVQGPWNEEAFIRKSVSRGWSDAQISGALKDQEAAMAAGKAYDIAAADLRKYSAAAADAAGRLEYFNTQVEASRAAASAARQNARAAKEQATAQARAAREQTAAQRRSASQGRQALGALTGMRVFSGLGTMAAVGGLMALASAASSLGQSLWDAALKDDQFRDSIAQVKGNLSVAFQAVYQAALPALQVLASWLATATNYFAQFVATVFGVSYDSAVAGAKKEADGIKKIGGAAKSTKRALAGFDEANILSFPGGGGGGGTTAVDVTPTLTVEPLDLPKWLSMLLGKEPFNASDFWQSLTGGSLLASVLLGFALEPMFPAIGLFLPVFLKAWDMWQNGLTTEQKTVILEALTKIDLAILSPAFVWARTIREKIMNWWSGLSDKDKTAALIALAQIGFSFLFGPTAGFITVFRLAWSKWNTLTPEQKTVALNGTISAALDIIFAPIKTIILAIQQAWEAWKTRNGGMGGSDPVNAGSINATAGVSLSLKLPKWNDILDGIKKAWNNIISGKSATVSMSAGVSASGALSNVFPVTWGATGGILSRATLIGAGEAGHEALLPLDRNTGWMDDLAARIVGSGGGESDTPLIITLDGDVVYRGVINRAAQERRRTGLSPVPV